MVFVAELVQALGRLVIYGLLLFVPAWTVRWWQAWVLLGLTLAALLLTRFWAMADKADLRTARRRPPIQAGQPIADKVLVVCFLVVIPAYLVLIPLDVFRFHLAQRPTLLFSVLGLLGAVSGWFIVALAFRANSFAVTIVGDQVDRNQIVVDTGIYRFVRHPLYAGVILILVGVALWLGSVAAAYASVIPIGMIVARISVEERFLRNRLADYRAYAARVRYRLIPRIW